MIVQCDCLNTGFVSVLDVSDGMEVRRIERNDVATWSTPTVIQTETETQLICNGYREMAGYSLQTGKQLWTIQGGGDVPVPAPLTAHGLILLTNGHGRSPIYAISPTARGSLTPGSDGDGLPDGLVWWQPRGGSYISTPIIVGDILYLVSSRGVLAAHEVRTGTPVYRQRVGGQFSASAVAGSSHLYLCSETGTVSVIRTGTDYTLSATNDMREPVFATPAVVGDRLLIRTTRHLYAIGIPEAPPSS